MIKTDDLVGFIEYQKDAVVSKTLIDKSVGTISLFSFDVGQGLSEHTAPYDAFVQILDGSGEITIDGEPRTVSCGGFIITPANKPHSLKAIEKFKMLLVMIRE